MNRLELRGQKTDNKRILISRPERANTMLPKKYGNLLAALVLTIFAPPACKFGSDGFPLSQSLPDTGWSNPTPSPTPSPNPSPSPSPVPEEKMLFGVNGHDGRTDYPLAQTEAVFKKLDQNNLRTYRVDISPGSFTVMDKLVPLAKKYNIKLRPMIYPVAQATAYNFVKRYAQDIEIWEIGNEQDYQRAGAQDRINAMMETYRGIKQVASETGLNIKTSINIMACNDIPAESRCYNDPNGGMWFLDMARASGFNFDYITFHYYAYLGEKGFWMDKYLGQMRAVATKYKTKIFLNETHCAEIYSGAENGDGDCVASVRELFDEIKEKYSDIVQEINVYELFDQPSLSADIPQHEKHFGLMYDINSPKDTFNLLVEYAKK